MPWTPPPGGVAEEQMNSRSSGAVYGTGRATGRVIVGRTADNDLHIDSRFISRHHCQVITTPHSCVIEDLNSTNGIFVKSNRVRRHYLNDGDVVLVGKHELIYVDERAPRTRATLSDTIPGLRTLQENGVAGSQVHEEEDGAASAPLK